MRESDILYSNGPFWVRCELFGSGRLNPKSEGFAVYRDGLTYATRVASIGWSGDVPAGESPESYYTRGIAVYR